MDNSRSLLFPRQSSRQGARTGAGTRIRLSAGECWTPQPAEPVTLRCIEGRFWWTQAGDTRDHLLNAGQQLTVAARDRVVLQALTGGELVVEDRI